jgi:hypothetical protein
MQTHALLQGIASRLNQQPGHWAENFVRRIRERRNPRDLEKDMPEFAPIARKDGTCKPLAEVSRARLVYRWE